MNVELGICYTLRKEVIFVMNREELINELRVICNMFTDILGKVILFGSYSRDEASDDSDIDLYVEPKESSLTTAKFGMNKRYKEFKYALYDRFPTQFDILSYGGKKDIGTIKKSPLWKQIEKDGVLIYDQRTKAV